MKSQRRTQIDRPGGRSICRRRECPRLRGLDPDAVNGGRGGGDRATTGGGVDVRGDLPGERLYGTMLGWADETVVQHLVARGDYVIAFDGFTGQLLKDVQVHGAMLLHIVTTMAPGCRPVVGNAKMCLSIGTF